jgi:nucleoside-diphosphate-sugar epimerase
MTDPSCQFQPAAFSFQQLLDVLAKPEYADLLKDNFPKHVAGKPGTPAPKQNVIDASKAKKTFGWEPIPVEKIVEDMTKSLAERQKEW